MTRYVTLTVQVRPHGESVEVDGHKFEKPEELWQYLHAGASALARKDPSLGQSVFISSKETEAWAAAIARGERGPDAGKVVYAKPPGGVAITRYLPGRGVDTSKQKIEGKTLEDLGL